MSATRAHFASVAFLYLKELSHGQEAIQESLLRNRIEQCPACDRHPGHQQHVADVERAVMRGAVLSGDAGPVHPEHDGKIPPVYQSQCTSSAQNQVHGAFASAQARGAVCAES